MIVIRCRASRLDTCRYDRTAQQTSPLEAIRPRLEETEAMLDQIVKHLEAAKPGSGEAKA